jgi:hypothetical protein
MNIFVVSSHNNIIKCLLNEIYGTNEFTNTIDFQYCAIIKITISGLLKENEKNPVPFDRKLKNIKFETKFLYEGQVENSENSKYKYLYKYLDEFNNLEFNDTNENTTKFMNNFLKDLSMPRNNDFVDLDYSSKKVDNLSRDADNLSFKYVFYLISNAEPSKNITKTNAPKIIYTYKKERNGTEGNEIEKYEREGITDYGIVQAKAAAEILKLDIESTSSDQKKRIRFYASDLARSRVTIAYFIENIYKYYDQLSGTEGQTDIKSEMIILPCAVEIANVDKCNDYPEKDFIYKKYNGSEYYSEKFVLPLSAFEINVDLQLYFRELTRNLNTDHVKHKCSTKNIINIIISDKDAPRLIFTGGKKSGKKYNRTRSALRSFRAIGRKSRSRKMRKTNSVKHIF